MNFMEIGLFQLENLLHTPTSFLFLDLRPEQKELPPLIQNCLRRAIPVDPKGIPKKLEELKAPRNLPMVLICDDGQSSARAAEELFQQGHTQIYVVAGGTGGLLLELEP